MKIAVIGVGAMGSIYAALLADAGHEVWAVDTWAEHVAEIQSVGLRVTGASGDRTVRSVKAVGSIADAGACDLYIIATKASGVSAAARALNTVASPKSVVLTIQNGLGAGERISEYLPQSHVMLGVADGFGASMVGPGHAHHTSMKLIRIGEMSGGMSERLKAVEAVWRKAGFNAQSFEDINQLIWEKFLCNVTLSAPCTVFGTNVAELRSDREKWAIALGCMKEAYAIGQATGIQFGFEDPVDYVTGFAEAVGNAKPSMLQDFEAGRVSELDAINGRVPVLGKKLGINTPFNTVLSEIIRTREASF